eukprot:SAG22_NODE_18185_length_291_cov_1.276042_1_plen_41_part_01
MGAENEASKILKIYICDRVYRIPEDVTQTDRTERQWLVIIV